MAMKKILAIMQGICLMLLLIGQSAAFAAVPVVDQAKLLSTSQREALTAKIQQVEAAHKVKIGICTMQDLPGGMSAGKYANNILDKNYANGEKGSIVLVLAMGSRDWYISTDNNMRAKITDDVGINGLKNLFLDDLSNGDYSDGFNHFVDGVDKYLSYYETEGVPYDPADEFDMFAAIIAVMVAAAGGFGFAYYLICGMSNVAPAVEAAAYLKQDSVDIFQRQDRYLYTTVTRRKKSKSSDSSSSASDSSHGGGGGKF
jgi:uncharacterized protein